MGLVQIYFVSIVGVVCHELLVLLYGMAYKRGGLFGMAVYLAAGGTVGFAVLGMTTALTRFACRDFATNVLLPFLMKQPMALIAAPVILGLGRIVALHHRSSNLYQIHEYSRCLYC